MSDFGESWEWCWHYVPKACLECNNQCKEYIQACNNHDAVGG